MNRKDVMRKLPWFVSDFTDAIHVQVSGHKVALFNCKMAQLIEDIMLTYKL